MPGQASGLSNITDLLSLFKAPGGFTQTTTPGTQTTSENVSPEAVQALVQSILQGNNGIAAIASGEKSSGGYNSTTKELLTNDLIARTAAQAASLNKTQTVTNNGSVTVRSPQNQLSAGKTAATILAGQAANQLLGPTLKGVSKKLGLDTAGDKLANTILGNESSAPATLAGSITQGPTDLATPAINAGAASDAANIGLDTSTDVFGNPAGLAADVSASSDVAGSITGGLTGSITGGATDLAAGAIDAGAAADVAAGSGFTAGAGADIAAGVGTDVAAGAATDIAAGAATDAGIGDALIEVAALWIVCTELKNQGRMNPRWYRHGARVFTAYPQVIKDGYYVWAIPSVRHLRTKPNSFYSHLLEIIFNWRAENIAAYYYEPRARSLIRGSLVTMFLYPICFILGVVCKKHSPYEVYANNKEHL